jgi:hypothetical protein
LYFDVERVLYRERRVCLHLCILYYRISMVGIG